MGATLQHFYDKFDEFKSLNAGEPFTILVTDAEATQAAKEFLAENSAQVKQMIQNAAGMSLDVSDPMISFHPDEIIASAKGGKGFLKFKATLDANVVWDNGLNVNVKSVDVPVVKITPEKLNSVVKDPLAVGVNKVQEYAEICSFKISDGNVVLEAVNS